MANQYTKKKDLLNKKQKKANRKATQKKYDESAKGKASSARYAQTEGYRESQRKYRSSPKGIAARKAYRQSAKQKKMDEQYRENRIALKEKGDEQLYLHELWRGTVNNAKKHGFIHEHPTFISFWNLWVKQKKEFGSSNAEILHVGDIVAWSKWSEEINDWVEYMGVLVSIQNEI